MESSTKKRAVELSKSFGDPLAMQKSIGRKGLPRVTDNFAVVGAILQQPAQFFQEIRDGVRLGEKLLLPLARSGSMWSPRPFGMICPFALLPRKSTSLFMPS